jgi:lysophospholipase L1-like esterase
VSQSGHRQALLRALSLLVGSALGLVAAALLLAGYVTYCRVTHTPLDERLRRQPFVRRHLVDPAFERFHAELSLHDPGFFRALWGIDRSVAMSRALFNPETMDGESKYRYKPSLSALDVTLWSGYDWRSYLLKPKPRVVAALRSCTILREIAFETDARGCKRSLPEQPGWPAVLFVGDSFTEGLHVASEHTFVARFGALARGAGLRLNVVNAGTNGYAALEEAWTVEHLASEVRAQLVVVGLFPNDVETDYLKVVAEGAPEASYARMFRQLERIRDFCAARRLRLLVAALPSVEQVRGRATDRHWQQRVAAWCRERQVDCLDPLARFRESASAGLFFDWDPHFSEAGHRLYAELLFAHTLPRLRQEFVTD